jgi:hypothetical protein
MTDGGTSAMKTLDFLVHVIKQAEEIAAACPVEDLRPLQKRGDTTNNLISDHKRISQPYSER